MVRMGLSHLPADELAAWVEASCAAQGVPVKVTDAAVVRRVGMLLGAGADGSRAPAEREHAGRPHGGQ